MSKSSATHSRSGATELSSGLLCPNHMNEILLEVPGWEGHYYVCEICQSVYTKGYNDKLRKMKYSHGSGGYPEITLSRKIKDVTARKHYLASRVLLAAYTKTPLTVKRDAHHKNGNRYDLSQKNLMWLTRRQNVSRYYKLGKLNHELFDRRQEDDPF